MREQLKFLYEGGRVQRFHCQALVKPQNVAEHSFYVAALVALMYGDCEGQALRGLRILAAALWHDLAEHKIGDVQSPAKRASKELKNILDTMEAASLKTVGLWTNLDAVEKRMLKMADNLDVLATCLRERTLGNLTLEEVYENNKSYIEKLEPVGKELEVFHLITSQWEELNGSQR